MQATEIKKEEKLMRNKVCLQCGTSFKGESKDLVCGNCKIRTLPKRHHWERIFVFPFAMLPLAIVNPLIPLTAFVFMGFVYADCVITERLKGSAVDLKPRILTNSLNSKEDTLDEDNVDTDPEGEGEGLILFNDPMFPSEE